MGGIGGVLLFFGLGSIGLHFLGREFLLLSWVDNWGESIGWAIRIGLSVVGAVLLFLGWNDDEDEPAEPTE